MNTFELLEKIAKQGLGATSSEEMVKLACAYWHENFFPDVGKVNQLPSDQQRLIGYLTEFFSMFNCVDESRALRLVDISAKIKTAVNPIPANDNADDVAGEWGLEENMNSFLGDILHYQTRHYRHNV